MSSLNTRGGTTIKNRILSGGSGEEVNDCAFSVMAYETENLDTYKAFVEDGEINFTSFYAKNGGGTVNAELSITPDCELALMVIFNSNDYEYKSIQEIYVVQFDANNRDQFSTQVVDYGNGEYNITMYIPLAYVYLEQPENPDSRPIVRVKQYFCGNLNFRMYFTTINGAPCFEFFNTFGITPGLIPESSDSGS